MQEGSIGLITAIDHFDPSRGIDFRRYARWHVRRAMLEALTEQLRVVRLPKHIVERLRVLARTEAAIAAASGHAASPKQLSAATGLPVAAVVEARASPAARISLDDPVDDDDGASLGALLADPTAVDPEAEAVDHDLLQRLRAALSELPEREQEVIARHFGLDGASESVVELAASLGLSTERVRTIERAALYRLAVDLEGVKRSAGRPRGRATGPARRGRPHAKPRAARTRSARSLERPTARTP